MIRSSCLLALLAGCGAAQALPTAGPSREAGLDVAALLPAGSDHCSIARPSLVAERRRPLLAREPVSEAIAWTRHPPLVAFGSATVGGGGALPTRYIVMRLAEPLGRDREALQSALPLRVRFQDEPCHDDGCDLPVAQVLDDWTVRVRRGPERPREHGESPCAALARAYPRALAVGVRTPSWARPRVRGRPTQIREHVELTSEGIRRVEEHVYPSADAAARDERAVAGGTSIHSGRVELHGAALREITERSWEELELAAVDEEIARDATRRAADARRPLAVSRVDVERLSVVLEQARLRRGRLARASGRDRQEQAAELVELFERALALRPDETPLAIEAARLALDELDDPLRALAIADAARSEALVTHRELLACVRREASARAAPESLPRALSDDGIVPSAQAALAAARLQRAIADGAPYELAERAIRLSLETRPAVVASALDVAVDATLEGLPEALAALAELRGQSVEEVVLRVVGAAAGPRVARFDGRVVAVAVDALDGGEGQCVVVGVARGTEPLAALGRSVLGLLAAGGVSLTIELRLADGSTQTLSAIGALRLDGRLALRAASAPGGMPLARVERLLAAPLSRLAARRFPAPELRISASDASEAQRVREALGEDAARCSFEAARLTCAPDPANPELMRALLLRIASTFVER